MKRLITVTALLIAAACSSSPAVEPVMDVTQDLSSGDSGFDTLRQDSLLPDQIADLAKPDAAQPDIGLPDVPDVVLDVSDLVPDGTSPDVADVPEPDSEPEDVTPDLMPAEPTCYDYIECSRAGNCGPGSPCPQCEAMLQGKVVQEFNALSDCIQTNCAQLSGEAFGECIWTVCATQWLECIGGEGLGDCDDVLTCAADCDQFSDSQCMELCVEMSSQEALELVMKIFGGDEGDNQSFAYVADCVGGQGAGSCMEAMSCMNLCGEDNPPCTVECLKQTSAEAVEKLKALIGCGGQPCFIPAVDCIGGSGTTACYPTLQCVGACGANDDGTCFTGCVSKASPDAAQQLISFSTCLEEKCNGVMQNCPAAQECLQLCPQQ